MKLFRRKQKLVNRPMQGTLIGRLTLYIVAYNLAILGLMVVGYAFQSTTAVVSDSVGTDGSFSLKAQLLMVGGCMLFMLPFIVYDMLNLTNRVAGPIYRYQQILSDFVKSGALNRAKTRDRDLLKSFEQQFNEFVEAVHTLYPETIPVSKDDDGSDVGSKSASTKPSGSQPSLPNSKSVRS